MFKKMRKLSAVLLALTMMLALAVSAYADSSVFKTPAKNDIDCSVVGDISADGFTIKADVMTDVSKSINYYIQGDGLDPEYWNDPDAYVEIDLTLKSDSSTVYAIMPAFTADWSWVNPSVWDSYLKEGKTVTLREPLTTFYTGFEDSTPLLIRVQIGSNAAELETVEIEVGAIRIAGADSAPVEDDSPDDTSSDDSASDDESVPDEESTTDEESSSAPAEESEPDEESSSASSDSSDAVSSTTSTSAPASSNTSSGSGSGSTDDGGATIVVIIIIVAVVVIGGVVAGVIIYRKKKYY